LSLAHFLKSAVQNLKGIFDGFATPGILRR